jgi:hypothetical protein
VGVCWLIRLEHVDANVLGVDGDFITPDLAGRIRGCSARGKEETYSGHLFQRNVARLLDEELLQAGADDEESEVEEQELVFWRRDLA